MPELSASTVVPMYYESIGSGMPVVFIHPPHMDHIVFHYQRELAEHVRVILYDIRGHGRSGTDAEVPTMSRLAADLRDLLDEMAVDEAVLCGYSSGASVAQAFALAYPERTKALILSGGFPRVNTWILKNEFRAGMALVKAGQQRFLSHVLSFSHHIMDDDRRKLFKHCIKADEQTAYGYYRESLHYNCTDRLHELTVPLLLLNGSRSYHLHPYMKDYLRRVKRVQSVFIANTTHQLPTKGRHPFNHAVKQFVQALD